MNGDRTSETAASWQVLAVGESPDIRTIKQILLERFDSRSILATPTVDRVDSLLEDRDVNCILCGADPDVIRSLRNTAPDGVIFSVGSGLSSDKHTAEQAIVAGATDVIDTEAPSAVIESRIQNALERGSGKQVVPLGRETDTSADERRQTRTILEAAPVITVVIQPDGRVEYATPSLVRQTGYTPDDLIRSGSVFDWFVHPDDRERLRRRIDEVISLPNDPSRFETIRLRHADGTFHVYDVSIVDRLEDPQVGGIVFTAVDFSVRQPDRSITAAIDSVDAVNTVDETHEQDGPRLDEVTSDETRSQLLRDLSDDIGDRFDTPVFVVGQHDELTYANSSAISLFDATTEDLLGTVLWELLPEAIRRTYYERITEARERQQFVAFDVVREMDTEQPSGSSDSESSTGIDSTDEHPGSVDHNALSVHLHPVGDTVIVYASPMRTDPMNTSSQSRRELLESTLDALDDPVFVVDDSTIELANGALFDLTGADALAGRSLSNVFDSELVTTIRRLAEARPVNRDDPVEVETELDGELTAVSIVVRPIPDSTYRVCVLRLREDLAESGAVQPVLERTVDELGAIDRRANVHRTVVDVIESIPEVSTAVWFRQVDDRVHPISVAPQSAADRFSPIHVDHKLEYVNGSKVTETIAASRLGPLIADDSDQRPAVVMLPMGGHGFIVVIPSDVDSANGLDSITDSDDTSESTTDWSVPFLSVGSVRPRDPVDFLESIRQLVMVVLDRFDLEETVADREWLLADRERQLDRLDTLLESLRTIDQTIWNADRRSAIVEGTCTTLAALEWIDFVWIGDIDSGAERVVPDGFEGLDESYLQELALGFGDSDVEPSVRSAMTGAVTVVDDVSREYPTVGWGRRALEHDFRSVLSVPIEFGGVRYGTLSAYASEAFVFDDDRVAALSHVGQTVGFGIHTIETTFAKLDDAPLELVLALESDDPLSRLAGGLDTRVRIHNVLPRSDDSLMILCSVAHTSIDAIRDTAADIEQFESVELLIEREDFTRVELVLSSAPLLETVAAHGGTVQSIDSTGRDGHRMRSLVMVHQDVDVRTFVESIDSTYPGTTLVSRRSHRKSVENGVFIDELRDRLTAQQRRTLRTAFYSGFFEWPRERTGEEVAASLDISQPTFNRHFRTAERKLFSLLFDDYDFE